MKKLLPALFASLIALGVAVNPVAAQQKKEEKKEQKK